MTTEELAEYYAGLLILQYVQKPKAYATIKLLTKPVILDQIPVAIQEAFNLLTATGVQLDAFGKYVGVSRNVYTLTQPIMLNDEDFRTLIKMVVIKNNAGSSLAEIQNLLSLNFPNAIRISDNQSMGLNYVIAESLGTPDLLEVIIVGGYLPRPMGVSASVTIVPSLDINYFGFRDYNVLPPNTSPFNAYAFYQLTFPWLSYSGVS